MIALQALMAASIIQHRTVVAYRKEPDVPPHS